MVYGTPLMAVSLFQYFGITLSSTNDDWPAVEQNLRRERGKWGRLAKILGREGKDRRTGGEVLWDGGVSVAPVWVRDAGPDPPVGEIPR